MSTTIEKLVKLNKEKKEQFKEIYNQSEDNYKNILKGHVWKIGKDKAGWFLSKTYVKPSNKIRLYTISQLFITLELRFDYISNISEVKNMPTDIIKNYYLSEKEWSRVCSIIKDAGNVNSLSIIQVPDIDNYISKAILFGKYELVREKPYYAILKGVNESDYILLSDLTFLVDTNTNFSLCGLRIKDIKIMNVDISRINSLRYLFDNCYKTETIVLKNFNTKHITDMGYMFAECHALKNVNIEELNTENVESFDYMFCNCWSIEKLDLNTFYVRNAENLSRMFCNCANLKELRLEKWVLPNNKKVSCNYMFSGATKLKGLKKELFKQIIENGYNIVDMFLGTEYESYYNSLKSKE